MTNTALTLDARGRRAPHVLTELALAASFLGWCGMLLAIRALGTGHIAYAFLVWNLFLAAIPYAISLRLSRCRSRTGLALLGAAWLVFYPNAPYLLTDLLHLYGKPGAPVWYDLLLLISAAAAGLFLAFASLRRLHGLVNAATHPLCGWAFAGAVLFLAAYGIALGRFERWNSWDVIASPFALARDIAAQWLSPLEHARTWGMTVGLAVPMILAYVAAITARGPLEAGRRARTSA